jgi:MFS family permease
VRAALAPLRHRPFRLLFFGRLASLAGSAVAPIALAFAVLEVGGSATDLGVVLAVGTLPQIALFLFGGVIADRLPRNLVMVASDVVSAAAQVVTAVLVLSGDVEIWHLAALNGIRGAAVAFFFPAAQGLTPQTVPNAQLQEANALLRLTFAGTNIVGAALGGLLVATVGPGWALAWDAATYLVGGALIAAIRVPSTRLAAAGSTVLQELRDGWAEFSSRTWLWAIVAAAALGNMANQIGFTVLGPVIADEQLGGAGAWGAIVSAMGVGFLLGGLAAFRLRPRRPLLFGQSIVVLGAGAMIGLALGLPAWGVALLAVVSGASFELFGVFWELSLQQHVRRARLSRVASYDALGSFVAVPIGQVLAGPLAAAVGASAAVWIAVLVYVTAQSACLLVPDVRRLERTDVAAGGPGTQAPTLEADDTEAEHAVAQPDVP